MEVKFLSWRVNVPWNMPTIENHGGDLNLDPGQNFFYEDSPLPLPLFRLPKTPTCAETTGKRERKCVYVSEWRENLEVCVFLTIIIFDSWMYDTLRKK